MVDVKAARATTDDLAAPLKLLEEHLRDSEPVSEALLGQLRESIEAGSIEVLVASENENPCGVAVISYRPNVSLGGAFASIEDLYVRPNARRRGVGRALLDSVDQRCASRSISYVEAQVEYEDAASFYSAVGYEVESEVRVFSRSRPLHPVSENG
jgi:GNAT superfamily N-acetyltransferase